MGDMMNLIPMVFDKSSDLIGYDIYSKLLENRIIFISGEIDDNLSNTVIAELLYLDSISNEDIYIYINSIGGSVSSGLSIYDTINIIKSDVCTVGIGICASMGAFLLSSGCKGKRFILENTEVMIHQVSSGFEGQTDNIKLMSDRIFVLQKRLNKILSKNTHKSLKKIEADIKHDYYMDSIQSIEYGIVDKILK